MVPNTIHGSLRRILIGKSFGSIFGARDGLVSFKNGERTRGASSCVLYVSLYVTDGYFRIPSYHFCWVPMFAEEFLRREESKECVPHFSFPSSVPPYFYCL